MRDNKLDKILKAATDLFGSKGFDGTSMQDIADKVGLHKSTLFHYVDTKKQLLLLILETSALTNLENLAVIARSEDLEPEEKLRRAIKIHLRGILEDVKGTNVYFSAASALPEKQRAAFKEKQRLYQAEFQVIVADMKRKGYFGSLDENIVTFFILGMLHSVARWFKVKGPLSVEEVAETMWRMIVERPSLSSPVAGMQQVRK